MNDIKLSFKSKSVKFIEYDNRVVCKLPCRIYDISLLGIGTARLKEGDIYDKNLARKIALAKAENNAYKKAKGLISGLLDDLCVELNTYYAFLNKAENVIDHNEKYIKDLAGV